VYGAADGSHATSYGGQELSKEHQELSQEHQEGASSVRFCGLIPGLQVLQPER